MKILHSDELQIAETTLYAHLPKSIKVSSSLRLFHVEGRNRVALVKVF